MMKNTKKIASLLLALAMILAMATTAFAADPTYSITIKNSDSGYFYEAYQIFAGSADQGGLANVSWGSSVVNAASLGDPNAIAEKLDKNYEGTYKLTPEDVLAMVQLGSALADSGKTADPYVITGLPAGYYLVKVPDGYLDGKDAAYADLIVRVVEDTIIKPKSSVPVVEKTTKDINDSTDTEMSDWQDSADHDLGDDVPFRLKAILANNV